jgi:hypothetical protein
MNYTVGITSLVTQYGMEVTYCFTQDFREEIMYARKYKRGLCFTAVNISVARLKIDLVGFSETLVPLYRTA